DIRVVAGEVAGIDDDVRAVCGYAIERVSDVRVGDSRSDMKVTQLSECAATERFRKPPNRQRPPDHLEPVRLDEPRVQPDPGACHGGRSRRIQQTATRNE